MVKSKTKLIFTIVPIVIIFTIAGFFSVSNFNNQGLAYSEKPAAGKLKAMALDAFLYKENDAQARALYEVSKKQYEYVQDTTTDQTTYDDVTNEIADCELMINLINALDVTDNNII